MHIKELSEHYGINIHIIKHSLTYLGFSTANLNNNNKINLSENQLAVLTQFILDNYLVDLKLKEFRVMNIKTLKALKTYKGYRHIYNLPVNGQRTKTNAKTKKKK